MSEQREPGSSEHEYKPSQVYCSIWQTWHSIFEAAAHGWVDGRQRGMNKLDPTILRRVTISRSNPNEILTLINTVTHFIVQHPTGLALIIQLTVLISFHELCKDMSIDCSAYHLNNTVDQHLFDNYRSQPGNINFSSCYY